MGKCRSGCAEHENEGFYYRLLSLYNSYFLHLYPMPEQKIENIKKNNKIQKNSPEILFVLAFNAQRFGQFGRQRSGLGFAVVVELSDHRLSSDLS